MDSPMNSPPRRSWRLRSQRSNQQQDTPPRPAPPKLAPPNRSHTSGQRSETTSLTSAARSNQDIPEAVNLSAQDGASETSIGTIRVQAKGYNAFTEYLKQKSPDISQITNILRWQKDINGQQANISRFKESALLNKSFVPFLIMTPGDPNIRILHGHTKYSSPLSVPALQNKDIAFSGNRTAFNEPTAVYLQVAKSWEWVSCHIKNTKNFTEVTRNDMYTLLNQTNDSTETTVPRMIAVPPKALSFIVDSDGACPPAKFHKLLLEKITKDNLNINDWALVLTWCRVAQIKEADDKPTNSILALSFNAVMSEDPTFTAFCISWVDSYLGTRPGEAQERPSTPPCRTSDVTNMMHTLATSIGDAISKQRKTTSAPSPSRDDDKGWTYNDDKLATIMGFCHIDNPNDIPDVWHSGFSITKNCDTLRYLLKDYMRAWANTTEGAKIDGAVNFSEQFLTDIGSLKFNHGGASGDIKWIGRGITIMTCLPHGVGEWEELLAEEEAARRTTTTRTLDDELKRSKGTRRDPPSTYGDLCLAIDTFAALLWTLFGDKCDYYKKIMAVRSLLYSDIVLSHRSRLTSSVIKTYVWAIIDDGRDYFSKRLLRLHFKKSPIPFPVSLLDDIYSNVRFGKDVERVNFPQAWSTAGSAQGSSTTRTPTGNSGGSATGQTQPSQTQRQKRSNSWGQRQTSTSSSASTWNKPPSVPPPTSWGTQNQWTDERHPAIISMMREVVDKHGLDNPSLSAILAPTGKRIPDLPTLEGVPVLCWGHALGKCTIGRCRYKSKGGHVSRDKYTDAWADATVSLLQPGINALLTGGEPPTKKQKTDKEPSST